MNVATLVGRVLAELGVETVFGVVGSGNFHVTNALVANGARYVAARHEGGAATMADAYARMSGKVGVVSVHQGPGLTNAMTRPGRGRQEPHAADRAGGGGDAGALQLHIDQDAMARAVGAVALRVGSAATAVEDAVGAFRAARAGRDRAAQPASRRAERGRGRGRGVERGVAAGRRERPPRLVRPRGGARARRRRRTAGAAARRPRGGRCSWPDRGARHAGDELRALADRAGALLATSAVAKGLFRGSPWDLDVSGGFSSPLAAELIAGAGRAGRLGLRAQHVDDQTRQADRSAHQARPGGSRPRCHRRAPAGRAGRRRRHRVGGASGRGRPRRPARPGVPHARAGRAHRGAGAMARRAVRGGDGGGQDRPQDAHHRPGRPAAARPRRRHRLGQLHGLSGDVPGRARRARLLLHAGLFQSFGLGLASAIGAAVGAARQAARRGARRRRRADGGSPSWRPWCGSACRW
ncbi:thiamine pyrophosphate-binding protein [Nonomuraea dietziae]|uniref:thiamine pyrophosphate-binding protein n=1 Tax=Nonomuraea dietziae TaxID=65515 RepID=UPI0031E2B70A